MARQHKIAQGDLFTMNPPLSESITVLAAALGGKVSEISMLFCFYYTSN